MSTETELKLALQPRASGQVMAHPGVAAAAVGAPSRAHLLSIYYDTSRFELWTARSSIRLRRTPSGWVQTLKRGGAAAGGLHQREEYESPVPGQALDLGAIAHELAAAPPISRSVLRRLKPVFVTEFSRETRMLRLPTNAEIELSLDRGHIVAGTARAPICELELELKSGEPSDLFDLARALLAQLPVRPMYRSKAQRGYILAGWAEAPVKAPRVALDDSLTIGQAAARIVASGLEQVQANEDGMQAGADIEYLHQLRVGMRRLRSCFGIFARVLPEGALDPLRAELKWLGTRLGPARDWDVFACELLPQLERGLREIAPASEVESLRRSSAGLRAQAQRSARLALRSRRAAGLILDLGRIAAGGGVLRDAEAMRANAKSFTSPLLERRMERVLARVDRRKPQSAAELHALRIAVKKLRYAVEFFGPFYDAAKVKPFRDRLARLQDALGAINDANGMLERVRAAAGGESRLLDCVRGWSAHFVYQERAKFRELWRQFRRTRAFW